MQAMRCCLSSVGRLRQVIEGRELRFEFQPIIDVGDGGIHGYEALMRGPRESELAGPEALLEVARYAGLTVELETLSCVEAVRAFAALRLPGKLFLNASAPTLEGLAQQRGGALLRGASACGVAPGRIVLELTEHERVLDLAAFEGALEILRGQGMHLAIDDFGDGRSSLRLWAQLEPEIVKIDRFFVRAVSTDRRKLEVLGTVVRLAEAFGTPLVIEGVETAEELAIVRDLGCRFAQGYFLARPSAQPPRHTDAVVVDLLASRKLALMPPPALPADSLNTVEALAIHAPAVTAGDSCEAVLRLFAGHEGLHGVAVVEGDHPIGLINRRKFVDKLSQPFHTDLYGRRPCTLFMDANPLRVDRASTIDSLATVLMGENQRYLTDGFVITDGPRYFGLGTGERLVRAVTERRIEAARLANPLTCLPGNVPITEHIRRLLRAQASFAAAYFDLNDFKPYNDLYGYWRGDEMIKLAAAVITGNCDAHSDFVGHVGGDDFVVLFQSEDWEARCRRIVADFAQRARDLFDARELEQGGIEAEDRHGFKAFFALTTICAGVVCVEGGCCRDPETVASMAALAKKAAKGDAHHMHVAQACCADASGRFQHAAVA